MRRKNNFGFFKKLTSGQQLILLWSLLFLLILPAGVYLVLNPTAIAPRAYSPKKVSPVPTFKPIPIGFEQAAKLNGTNSYIITSKDSVVSMDFTTEIWVKPELKQDNVRYASQSAIVSETTPYKQFDWILSVYEYPTVEKLTLAFAMSVPGPSSRNWFLPNTLTPNKWQHVAVVAERGTLRIFIDGKDVLQDTYTPYSGKATWGPTGLVIGGTDFVTGEIDPNLLFKGEIDELRVSMGSRYTSEFTPPVAPFTPDKAAEFLYHFDGNTQDSSFNGKHGVIFGDVQFVPSNIPIPTPTPISNNPPVITTNFLTSGVVGRYYSSTISGRDPDPTDNLTMTVSNLPPGISFRQPCTGRRSVSCSLSGRPIKAGIWQVNIRLEDNRGGVATKTLPLKINVPPKPR